MLPFSPVHTKKERFKTVRFQKTPLWNRFRKFPFISMYSGV